MNKSFQPAQYLIRIDDVCPAMHAQRWHRMAALLRAVHIHAILAVIPDNRDPEMQFSPPYADFWPQIRAMEREGATIALHGWQHLCQQQGRSFIPLHRLGEFAGVPIDRQRKMIASGIRALCQEGLSPKLFVAPRHGFDGNTLRALQAEGIHYLSAGFARRPCLRRGLVWIPQQLWAPIVRPHSLWTICLHPNTMHASDFASLERFLAAHAAQCTSFDRVVSEYECRPLSWMERLQEAAYMYRIILRKKSVGMRVPSRAK